MALKVASWNVNSVRRRQEHITQWLASAAPDLLLLQELKCEENQFPLALFQAQGYNALLVGQKSYNGVAVVYKQELKVVERLRALPNESSGQARYLEVELDSWIISTLYLPNGNPTHNADGSIHEKFQLKLDWMQCLVSHAQTLRKLERPAILAGDYNIIPTARDCVNPADWHSDALYRSESRQVFRRLLNQGWADALDDLSTGKRVPSDTTPWTYWSYQGGAFDSDNGIRIDHLLLSPQAADRYQQGTIDRTPREEEGASDHTPVIAEFI